MLAPEPMSKVTVVGSSEYLEATISALHGLGAVHISDHVKDEHADIGKPLPSASTLSETLLRIRSIISQFKLAAADDIAQHKDMPLPEIQARLGEIEEAILVHQNKSKEITAALNAELSKATELRKVEGLPIPLDAFTTFKSLAIFLGEVRDAAQLGNALRALNGHYKLYAGTKSIALFVEASDAQRAEGILREHSFVQRSITPLLEMHGSIADNLAERLRTITNLEGELAELSSSLHRRISASGAFLFEAEHCLRHQTAKAEAPLRFATTERAFFIKGWAPSNATEKISNSLAAISPSLYVRFEKPGHSDHVPVKLDNPKAAKPFEFFMDLYTLPGYSEMDPTALIFLTFPLLFGFMLGDIGYGIVCLILFLILKKMIPKASGFFTILIWASLGTILFGALFGEFFGSEHVFGYELKHILSREHDIQRLLYLAIGVGILHLNLGIILGFINEKRHYGFMHAFFGKIGWIVLQAGAGLLALSYTHALPLSPLPGYAVLGASLFMIIKGEGIRGVVELPGILSNILSYGRLMAIGLSSVMLAVVINDSAFELFQKGIGGIIAGVLILVIGHAVNIGLGLLGSFLHSLRLHYVEFFTKFFHGGGTRFHPFGIE